MPLDLTDDGYESVRLLNPDGSVLFETSLDLWDCHAHLVDLQKKHAGQPAFAFHQAVVDYLKELGFPGVSHRFAARFLRGIDEKVLALKNIPAREPPPGSRASTAASTPSA